MEKMTVNLKPKIEKMVHKRVKSGQYRSAEELVNAAVEQFISDEFQPGELEKMLAVGEKQARRGQLIAGNEVFRRLQARSKSRRKSA